MSTNERRNPAIRVVHRVLLVLLSAGALCVAASNAGVAVRAENRSRAPEGVRAGDDDREGSVWVVNRDRGELTVFNARTGDVITTIPVGAGAHDICISETAGKAYVTAETIHMVTTVDIKTLATESIPVGPLPHHIEPSHDGHTVYVSLASHTSTVGAPQLAVIDTRDNSVSYTATSHNLAARSHGPHPSINGDKIYVAHDTGNELTGIDLDSGAIDFSIAPILRAEEVIPTKSGHALWVSSRGDGTVKRIDLDTHQITDSIPIGVQPESIMLTPNEHTLVASLRGSPATLGFVDAVSATFLGSVPIGGPGTFGDLAVITGDGRFVYATFDADIPGRGGVAVVDVRERQVIDTWTYPGSGRPHGIWYSTKKVRMPKEGPR